MDVQLIEQLIQQNLPEARVSVSSPDNVHFEALVVSPAFAGKAMLQRHRMIYAALGERMGGEIHALSIRAVTPAEQQPAE